MRNSMNNKTSQKGFTLIELVVVIVILGILAVTAAPKFIDLTSDAKASTIEAVKGSLNSAADMAHAKALVEGIADDGSLSIAGSSITFVNLYPSKDSINALMDIEITDNVSDAVFVLDTTGTSSAATYSYKGSTATSCQAIYTETSDKNTKPKITSNTTDC